MLMPKRPIFALKDRNAITPEMREDRQKFIASCVCPENDALALQESGANGLSEKEAAARLEKFGRNVPAMARKVSLVADLLERIKNPLVIQLLIICIVAALMGDIPSATIVAVMVVLSFVLSSYQERRSIKAAEELKNMVQTTTLVIRDNHELEIDIGDVVSGDIVVMAAGSIIPADLRILSAKDFYVNQSAMTGESMPAEKFPAPPASSVIEPLELPNACFQGSTVVSGAARGIVVLSGGHTFLGAISRNANQGQGADQFR